ncbi:MAG: hypothetical protein ACK5M1_11530 [Xanthomarina gelatinilytica]|uniref:hypothetical protein n=1 Tax=Xanthomarina gelatinilytica TaxID=1137281 RepID=UPI003A848F75
MKINNLFMFIMFLSVVLACSDNEEITQQETRAVQKTEAMKQFEASFIGIAKQQANLKQSKLNPETLNSEVLATASQYILSQGVVLVEQKANQAAVIKQALDLHLKQLQELQTLQNQKP